MPRMRILTANEQEAFDKPPVFDHRDRKKFFDFPKSLLTTAASMRNADHQIGFAGIFVRRDGSLRPWIFGNAILPV